MLSEPMHKRMVAIIVEAGLPCERWFRDASHRLRDPSASLQWLVSQLQGDFFEQLSQTWHQLCSVAVLDRCGFDRRAWRRTMAAPEPQELLQEDELAALLGGAVASMVSHRVSRCLWMLRGWPVGFAGFLGEEHLAQSTLQRFKADLSAYRTIAGKAQSAKLEALMRRSIFKQVSVQQYTQAFDEIGFGPESLGCIKELTARRFSVFMQSQLCEDTFAVMKNNKVVR
eukprot:5653298-Amphidinium_carterae.4